VLDISIYYNTFPFIVLVRKVFTYFIVHKIMNSFVITGTLILSWLVCKLVQSLWKSVWRFLKKLDTTKYDPAITLLVIYLKKCKLTYHQDTYTPMFIAALFTIAKKWNHWQTDKENVVYIHNGVFLSHKEE
jgi:hypothetical protein